jgi:hypothetical protein
LAQIGATAASRHTHRKSALGIVKNEPVFAAVLGHQLVDLPLTKLHGFPCIVRVRSGSADP